MGPSGVTLFPMQPPPSLPQLPRSSPFPTEPLQIVLPLSPTLQ